MSSSVALAPAAAVVAVDVGKTTAAVLVTDAARRRLLGPLEFPMHRPASARGYPFDGCAPRAVRT